MKCQYCEKSADLPFKCPFCGRYFCADHRLPETHECPELWQAKIRQPPTTLEHYQLGAEAKHEPPQMPEREQLTGYPFRFRTGGWTSPAEMLHLIAGALIVMAVGLSIHNPGSEWIFLVFEEPWILLSSALVFTVIFVSHELAHKATAKYYGLWAEFRLSLIGAVFTLISIAPTPLKIVSPGAVMISGVADKKTVGVTALAGPLTSITLMSLFFALHFLFPSGAFGLVVLRGAMLGAWIALQSLIPFGILDGAKVFWWNKLAWAVSFSASTISVLIALKYSFF